MTNEEILYRINVDLAKERAALQEGQRHIEAFGQKAKSVFSNIGRGADGLSRHFGMMSTAITALTSGLAVKKLFSVTDFIQLDTSMLKIQANLGRSAAQVKDFRKEMDNLASTRGYAPEAVFAAAAELSEVTQQPDEILKVLDAGTHAARAMNKDLGSTAQVLGRIERLWGVSVDKSHEVGDSIVAAKLDLEDLDSILQRGAIKGVTSENYKEALAFFSGLKKSGVERGRTVAAIASLWNAVGTKQAELRQGFMGAGLHADPRKMSRIEILQEIGEAEEVYRRLGMTQEQINKSLDKAFGANAGEGFGLMIAHLQQLRDAWKEQQDSAALAAEHEKTMNEGLGAQLDKIKANLGTIKEDYKFLYDLLKDPASWLAEHPQATKAGVEGGTALGLILGSFFLGKKIPGFLRGIGGTVAGTAEGELLKETAGVPSVFVVNMPGSLGGLLPGLAGGAGAVEAGLVAAAGALGMALAAALAVVLTLYSGEKYAPKVARALIEGGTPPQYYDRGTLMYDVRGFGGGPRGPVQVAPLEMQASHHHHIELSLRDQRTMVVSHDQNTSMTVHDRGQQ